jgi:nuclear receptor interaction protein
MCILSWSNNGRLLASGSDDHRINIHSYHPESSTSQFNLTTSILTGHRTNIFSVKFMPYSNDRTIVSATDDVRIFDIEHSGHSVYGSSSSGNRTGSGRYGARLTEADTNAKAFRSHNDTVKRIVTEDNPFYFLTCSEDGDVRQWDIRQPSKTYPPRRNLGTSGGASDNIPPPLISYSRYNLDLNTVSCSPSQPHYIALGGAHLHCFLHDRRMLGRDKYRERGAKLPSPGSWNDHDDELLGKATQCVKKFAPKGQKRMSRSDNGHITACKISDANPNELIVSWSGDWIYSFDIMRSPDVTEEIDISKVANGDLSHRVKEGRKRKRTRSTIISQESTERTGSRQRTESTHASSSDTHEGLSLRVNYGNGQSEEIRIQPSEAAPSETIEAPASDAEHFRIAKTVVRMLKQMVNLSKPAPNAIRDSLAAHTASFTSVIGFAASILPEIDDISRTWRYPIDPNRIDVSSQNHMRDGRAASRRFVQAAGTLARVLGGHLRTGGNSNAMISRYFATIHPAPNERPPPDHEAFGYDFLKAILLWLDSGLGALVEGFSSQSSSPRFPIAPNADIDAIEEVLIPYLFNLANDDPIVDVDVSKFENDDTRILYSSEKAAVLAFAQTLKIPFADLTGAVVPKPGDAAEEDEEVQDRQTALRHWAFKVGRGVLLNAAKDIRFAFVDRSFGGRGIPDASIRAEEEELREQQEDVDPLGDSDDDLRELIENVYDPQQDTPHSPDWDIEHEEAESSQPFLTAEDIVEEDENEDEDGEDSDGDIDPLASDEEAEDDEDVDSDGLSRTRSGRVLWRSDVDRSFMRERVESDVPCAPHTRCYTGHCNVRTVKDVNFFGLQDEYVVSGSDSGHVFIWDRKTSELVNILEGDGEVVNVVQGHPYEPTIAVSGIDHTIKIFSPDARDQANARRGIGVQKADPGLSSLGFRGRRLATAAADESASASRDTMDPDTMDSDEDEKVTENGLASRKRMHQEYQIVARNDVERRGGREDAFITRALLAQLAQRIYAHNAGEGDDEGGEGSLMIGNDEGCRTM